MDHGPVVEHEKDYASSFKSRVGFILFLVYGVIYAGFVIINTVTPQTMEMKVVFGLNLAVTYGFGLILLAILLGIVYNAVCTRKENALKRQGEEGV